jgi:hypothetical protein
MANITIFSLDYDGCGDVLFDQLMSRWGHLKFYLLPYKEKLEEFLARKTKVGNAVELYVGSNRQSNNLDRLGHFNNQNGWCFKNYQELCKKNKWTFRRLLAADIENGVEIGSAMTPCSTLDYTLPLNGSKVTIIENQLRDVAINHPNDKVDFYFIDDDPPQDSLIKKLIHHFETNPNAKKLLRNVRLHIVRFDRSESIEKAITVVRVLSYEELAKTHASQSSALEDSKPLSSAGKIGDCVSIPLSEEKNQHVELGSLLKSSERDSKDKEVEDIAKESKVVHQSPLIISRQENKNQKPVEMKWHVNQTSTHHISKRLIEKTRVDQRVYPSKKSLNQSILTVRKYNHDDNAKQDFFNKLCRGMLTFGLYSPLMHMKSILNVSKEKDRVDHSRRMY